MKNLGGRRENDTRSHDMAQFYRRPMMHFDRRELYTDLETRVRYLHSFLDFSTRTSRRRNSFARRRRRRS